MMHPVKQEDNNIMSAIQIGSDIENVAQNVANKIDSAENAQKESKNIGQDNLKSNEILSPAPSPSVSILVQQRERVAQTQIHHDGENGNAQGVDSTQNRSNYPIGFNSNSRISKQSVLKSVSESFQKHIEPEKSRSKINLQEFAPSNLQSELGPPLTQQLQQPQQSPQKSNSSERSPSVARSLGEHTAQKRSGIREIKEEKVRLQQELRRLNSELSGLQQPQNSYYRKRNEVNMNLEAHKEAQALVRQLQAQKKQLEERKKSHEERAKLIYEKQQEHIKQQTQSYLEMQKQTKRQIIQQRMKEEEMRREERQMVEREARGLVIQLKREAKLDKERQVGQQQEKESEIIWRIRLAAEERRKGKFVMKQIDQHERNYKMMMQLKEKEKEKERRVPREGTKIHYVSSIWREQLEREDNKVKEELRLKEKIRKDNLQKRIKYGQLVKKIFLPNRKNIFLPDLKHSALDPSQKTLAEGKISDESILRDHSQPHFLNEKEKHLPSASKMSSISEKPRTPQELPQLPKFRSKRKTHDTRLYQEKKSVSPLPENTTPQKPLIKQEKKELSAEEVRKRMREAELRKATKLRLDKIEKMSNEKLKKKEKEKALQRYENYLGKVKVKNGENHMAECQKIMSDERLSKEEKYQELVRKANQMESRAKLKEDLSQRGQEAIDLYIGSIQTKIALLQQF